MVVGWIVIAVGLALGLTAMVLLVRAEPDRTVAIMVGRREARLAVRVLQLLSIVFCSVGSVQITEVFWSLPVFAILVLAPTVVPLAHNRRVHARPS